MSTPSGNLGVGIVGLGFMGRTHARAYAALAAAGLPCQILAYCDHNPARVSRHTEESGNLNTGVEASWLSPHAVIVTRAEEVAADPRIGLVSICAPTDMHVALATMMLEAGKHVLVEKPVALDSRSVRALADVAARMQRLCVPAMCMRFWPGWDWLKERVLDGTLGRVRSAVFTRMGARPSWSASFYTDAARTGGALFDLHVHDTDFVTYLFGMPQSVRSTGTVDHLTTLYSCPGGPAHVVAEGAWFDQPSFPFRMRYLVEFEHAIADFDLSRAESPLLLIQAGRVDHVPIARGAGYEGEVRAVVEAVLEGRASVRADMEGAVRVTRVLEAERASMEANGAPVLITPC